MAESLLWTEQTGVVTIWSSRFARVMEDLRDVFDGEVMRWDPRHLVPAGSALLHDGRMEVQRRILSPKTVVSIGNLGLEPVRFAAYAAVDMYAQKAATRGDYIHNGLLLGPYGLRTSTLEDSDCLDFRFATKHRAFQAKVDPRVGEGDGLLHVKGRTMQDTMQVITHDYLQAVPLSARTGRDVAAGIMGVSDIEEAGRAFTEAAAKDTPFAAALTLFSQLKVLQGAAAITE